MGAGHGDSREGKWSDETQAACVQSKAFRRKQRPEPSLQEAPIPLPRRLQNILGERRTGYVFPGRKNARIEVDGADLQNKVRAASGLKDFFFHGIRHIVETKMAELKILPHIADLLLDHAPKRGSGKIYNHHNYSDEMLAALESWAAHIDRLTAGRAPVAVEKRRRT